jgi:hypothetical protein
MKLTLTLEMKAGSIEKDEAEAEMRRLIETRCGLSVSVSSLKPSLGTFQSIDPSVASLVVDVLNTKAALAISSGLGTAFVAWMWKWTGTKTLKLGNTSIPLPKSRSEASKQKILKACQKIIQNQLGLPAKAGKTTSPSVRRKKAQN